MSAWYGYGGSWGYPPKTTVRDRVARAAKQAAALAKKGKKLSPVVLEGRAIARTFWGKAWCENLERYSDYANRLPRGRSYVRSGSVLDLQIEPGRVEALVQGSRLYTIVITIAPVEPAVWKAIVGECAGKIDSAIELLQGKLSRSVMEVITRAETGLFPAPRRIRMDCSCPDSASLCKHLAAVLYGIGARLDAQPDLLFRLRGADPTELVTTAAGGAVIGTGEIAKERRLSADLGSVFGIDLDTGPAATRGAAPRKRAKAKAKKEAMEHPDWCTCATCKPGAA
jgi:uncharacterized Zn finger protein